MIKIRWFLALLMSLYAINACKSTRSSKVAEINGISGVFDENGSVRIPVPEDLKGFKPPVGSKTKSSIEMGQISAVKGLGLTAGPVTSEGIEEITYQCFDYASDFIMEGWFFYAELLSNGKVIKDFNAQSVNGCKQMQLTLKTLDRNKTYVVKAAFYWQSEDKKTTIVWYEGETKPFNPRDQDRTLVLAKLRIDQEVNVEVEKSEKDKCKQQDYLWSGLRCLNGFFGVSFLHADYSDYADAEAPKKRKCLDLSSSSAVMTECNYSVQQRLRPRLVSVQQIPKNVKALNGELGWFQLLFDSGPNGAPYCLSATIGTGGGATVIREACADANTFPPARQLWNLVPMGVGDKTAHDTFKLVSQFDNTVKCISVPPEPGAVSTGPSIRSGAPVKLTDCEIKDANVVKSQGIQFWGAED